MYPEPFIENFIDTNALLTRDPSSWLRGKLYPSVQSLC